MEDDRRNIPYDVENIEENYDKHMAPFVMYGSGTMLNFLSDSGETYGENSSENSYSSESSTRDLKTNVLELAEYMHKSISEAEVLIKQQLDALYRKEEQRKTHTQSIIEFFETMMSEKDQTLDEFLSVFFCHNQETLDEAKALIVRCRSLAMEFTNYDTGRTYASIGQHKAIYTSMKMWSEKIREELDKKYRVISEGFDSEGKERMPQSEWEALNGFLRDVSHQTIESNHFAILEKDLERELANEYKQKERYESEIHRMKQVRIDLEKELDFYVQRKKELDKVLDSKRKTIAKPTRNVDRKELKLLIKTKDTLLKEIQPVLQDIAQINDLYKKCFRFAREDEILDYLKQNLDTLKRK